MELQYAQPPSHEDILRVIRRNLNTEPSCEKVSCIEMSFLLQMVDLERRNMVFSNLTKSTGVTEGKFALLMVLHDAGMPLPVGELAARLRVSTPTASTMLQRMLVSPEKLIVKTPSATDARAQRSLRSPMPVRNISQTCFQATSSALKHSPLF